MEETIIIFNENYHTSNSMDMRPQIIDLENIESIKAAIKNIFGDNINYGANFINPTDFLTSKTDDIDAFYKKLKEETYSLLLVNIYGQILSQSCQVFMDEDKKKHLSSFLDAINDAKKGIKNELFQDLSLVQNSTLIPISYILYVLVIEYGLIYEGDKFLEKIGCSFLKKSQKESYV